jgi:hypothetical protein
VFGESSRCAVHVNGRAISANMFLQSGLHHDTLDVMARDPRIVNAFDDNAAAKARL